jgi:heptosyltransferase-2
MLTLSATPDAILVIGPNWIGDAVMSTPALVNLRRGFPKATIDLLVPRHVAPLFEGYAHLDRVLIHADRQPWRLRLAQTLALRRCRYDLALLLPNSFRAALQAWWLGAPRRVGYATDGRRWLLSQAVSGLQKRPVHQTAAYLHLVAALGLPIVERLPRLAPSPAAEVQAERLWSAQGLKGHEVVIGICPGAAFGPAKRWGAERFADLADRLTTSGGFRVVFFGSPDEVPLVDCIRTQMTSKAVSLAGQDTLGSFMALAARCAVMITNDSGSMHIANAVGTPIIALFGPTDPCRTAPLGAPATVLRRDLACSPCFRPTCPYPDHPCMRLIDVADVYRAVMDTLALGR